MAYTPNTWSDGDIVSRAKLDRLEAGVSAAHTAADSKAAADHTHPATAPTTGGSNAYVRGVAVAGAEFGSFGAAYGTGWQYDTQATFDYLASRGHKVIRLVFLWERVQTTLGGALDTTLLGHLTSAVGRIQAAGMTAILDMHNYGEYHSAPTYATQTMGQGVVTAAHLVDVWTKLANHFKNNAGVHGYGIMNEPRNLSTGTRRQRHDYWQTTSQQVVTGIRSTGDTKWIAVPGHVTYPGTSQSWIERHPVPWITDPAGKTMYEEHFYADSDVSGTYTQTFAAETTAAQTAGHADVIARSRSRLTPFLTWCRTNKVRGFIGEFGVPTTGADAAAWATVAEDVLDLADAYELSLTWWSTGEAFNAYALAPYVRATNGSGPVNTARLPAATVLEAHPSYTPAAGVVESTLDSLYAHRAPNGRLVSSQSPFRGQDGRWYQFVSGQIRRTGTDTWEFYDEGVRGPSNVAAVAVTGDAATGRIYNYSARRISITPAAGNARIVSAMAQPNALLAELGYRVTTEAGFDHIDLFLTYDGLSDAVFYNGTAWVSESGLTTPTFAGGDLTLTHAPVRYATSYSAQLTGVGGAFIPRIGWLTETQTIVQFYAPGATAKTTTASNAMSVYLHRPGSIIANLNSVTQTGHAIDVFAVFEII